MSGWGSWISSVAKTAVSEVAQFGTDVLDSVTEVEEAEETTAKPRSANAAATEGDSTTDAPSAENEREAQKDNQKKPSEAKGSSGNRLDRMMFGVGEEDDDNSDAKLATQEAAEATANKKSETKNKDQKGDESSWMPSGTGQGGLWSMASKLVEQGAGAALDYLPDIDEADASQEIPAQTGSAATAARAPATTPLEDQEALLAELRERRGLVELSRRNASSDEKTALEEVSEAVNPLAVGDFDPSADDDAVDEVQWIGETLAGRRLNLIRKESVLLVDDETEEALQPHQLFDRLDSFPAKASEASVDMINIILEEFVSVFAQAEDVGKLCGIEAKSATEQDRVELWWLRKDDAENDVQTRRLALACAAAALVRFAQVEMHRACQEMSSMCTDVLQWAKRSKDSEGVSKVKSTVLRVKGELIVACSDTSVLEEALECVASLIPCAFVEPVKDEKTVSASAVDEKPSETEPRDPAVEEEADEKRTTHQDPNACVEDLQPKQVSEPAAEEAPVASEPVSAKHDEAQDDNVNTVEEAKEPAEASANTDAPPKAGGKKGGRNKGKNKKK